MDYLELFILTAHFTVLFRIYIEVGYWMSQHKNNDWHW